MKRKVAALQVSLTEKGPPSQLLLDVIRIVCLDILQLCYDLKDTHPLHIEPVAAPGTDDAHKRLITGGTAYYRTYGALVDGEFTNCPGGAAMRTGRLGNRHFKGEHFPQDTPCGIAI